jgi:UDP-glucose 4-epimerase
MRILITGGFGFVGGRLAVHLAQKGNDIRLGSRKALSPPSWLPQADVVRMRWDDPVSLAQSCHKIDVVVHAAGMNAHDCAADPVAALEFNGVATARLVEAACQSGVERFAYLSTAHVYASPMEGIITEKTCPKNLHPYAVSHLAGEYALLGAHQRRLINGLVVRISNAFGAPVHPEAECWTLLCNDLCRQVVNQGRITLRSDGLQHRDFVPMTDVCRAIAHLLELPFERMSGQLYNIGGNWTPSVFDMASCIAERYRQITGDFPPISRQEPSGQVHRELQYRTDRLSDTGFRLAADRLGELDALIRFCVTAFGRG